MGITPVFTFARPTPDWRAFLPPVSIDAAVD
jgi:hypothetical protein